MKDQFTSSSPTVLYIDINSCFATIEQQARPAFRHKPLVVAAYATGNGCILASSYEAKAYGITTGMHVSEAIRRCPSVLITIPDPEKYRFVNKQLTRLLLEYSPCVQVQSIDEMIVRMEHTPYLAPYDSTPKLVAKRMFQLGREIKQRIKEKIGEYITVSVGIAPNAFLAKTASNWKKPDGLEMITGENVVEIFYSMKLTDLCGIKEGNATRLRTNGIASPLDMYGATPERLECAFRSVMGRYWWYWMHGYEMGTLYTPKEHEQQKSYNQSSSLRCPTKPLDLPSLQVLYQLIAKMALRLRNDGKCGRKIWVGYSFSDRTFWHRHMTCKHPVYATEDIYGFEKILIQEAPKKGIHTIFVGIQDIVSTLYAQQTLDEYEIKKQQRTQAIDTICEKFGSNSITSAIALQPTQRIVDRIAFGKRGFD